MVDNNENTIDSTMAGVEELSDFLPTQPTPAAPGKRDFRPWHKPRKQYIRRKQWCHEIGKLIKRIHFPTDNQVFRYLTLPSEDMLDIRVLESVLDQPNLKLKYLGFFNAKPGSDDDQQMNIAESEVKGLGRIDENSQVFRDLLEATGNQNSKAFNALENQAPYHAVNFDLCSHFAAPRRGNTKAFIDAIKSVAEVQTKKTNQSWLFFLTTRLQPDHVDAGHLAAFIAAIKDNLARSGDFQGKVKAIFQCQGDQLIGKIERAGAMTQEEFRYFFCIGFGKWFLGYLMAAHPQTQVEMLPSYYYSIQGEGQEMLSLAFRCTPRIGLPVDRYGLTDAPAADAPPLPDEATLGVNVAKQASELADLDALLAESAEQMEKMIKDSARFLKEAHFDIESYWDFALNEITA